MANDEDHSAAAARWVRTVAGEINRFQSLRPRRPRRELRYTPMPPEIKAMVDKSLALWSLTQSTRDRMVARTAQRMAGHRGVFALHHGGAIPEPEARRAAAAAEAEGFAAASAYAAGKSSLATDEERADVFRRYAQEVQRSAASRSRRQALAAAAGTSTAAPAAALPPPPAASVAGVSGPVQLLRLPSSSAARASSAAPEE